MSQALPSPVILLQNTFDAFMANPVGFIASGLALTLVGMGVAIGVGVVYGIGLAVLVPALAATGDAALASIGGVLALLAGLGVLVVGVVLTLPLSGSLMRVFDVDGSGAVSFKSPLARIQPDPFRIVTAGLAFMGLTFIGALFCLLPGLLLSWALFFALPAVVLDRTPIADAARLSYTLVSQNPGWALGVWAICVVSVAVLSQIPLIGTMIALPLVFDFQVRAFRAAFPAA